MFFLAILSCIALTQASVPLPIYRSQPYEFGYGINDHFWQISTGKFGKRFSVEGWGSSFTDARGIARESTISLTRRIQARVKTNETRNRQSKSSRCPSPPVLLMPKGVG
ncbi:hypothetical protein TNIN_219691 [Trichonephila inaurata madagascariensis]|uniref:Uncharacterized protein n=1 Tax=Trichonephila inaurata madagascariensis TaxID=2747483 RepID=A0A8X6XRS0_9ARAC|nr:hypothetical protein TNIN_219691 [Trichonephila inaurata madagascariensis]